MNRTLTLLTIALATMFTSQSLAQCAGCAGNVSPSFTQPMYTTVQSYAPVQSYSAPMQSTQMRGTPYGNARLIYSTGQGNNSVPMQSSSTAQSYTPVQSNAALEEHRAMLQKLRQAYRARPGYDSTRMQSYVAPQSVATPMGIAQMVYSSRQGNNPTTLANALRGRYRQPVYSSGTDAVPVTGSTLMNRTIVRDGGVFVEGKPVIEPSEDEVDQTPAPQADNLTPLVPAKDTGDGT